MPTNIVGKRNLRKVLEQKARIHPDKTFLISEDDNEKSTSYTYAEFDCIVNQLSNGLTSLGVRKGDKVNLHLTNCPEFLFSMFAIAKLGAVMVPTNPLSPPAELSYPVRHSDSVVSITQPDLLSGVLSIMDSCPKLDHVVVTGPKDTELAATNFTDLIEDQYSDLETITLDPLDEAAILYTSGTTSRPKGVLVTHGNYVYLSEVVSKTMRLGPDDRQFITLPLFHANAQYYSFMTALNVGASVALMPRFSASRFMDQARRYNCTVTSLFAAPIRMILAQPRKRSDRDNILRLVIFAQNVTEAQLGEWDDRFGAPMMQIYGMTETMGQPLVNPLDYDRDNMTIGMPSLGYECKVVDEDGNEVEEGVSGELLVKGKPGATIMKGYFKDSDTTKKTIRNGWLWTGDMVRVDPDGYFRFVDRSKDMIKRAGENIAAGEVEAVIKQHSAVADAVVIGVTDSMRDESVKAFVILKAESKATEIEIIEYCKARLSKFRVPEFVEFRNDFPRTSVGKIQKHILRHEEASGNSLTG